MKFIFTFFLTALTMMAICQNRFQPEKYKLTDAQRQTMLDNLPVKDGRLVYDSVIIMDSSQTKAQLFIKVRQWFVDNFKDSKAVLEIADSSNGILTGKGNYGYASKSGMKAGKIYFTINMAVKDGKLRCQLYDMVAEGVQVFGGDTNQNIDGMAAEWKRGNTKKNTRDFLFYVFDLVSFVDGSLKDLKNQSSSITNF